MQDHIQDLNCEGIADLDYGQFGEAVTRQIRLCVQDIVERPCDISGKTEKRKVVITLELNPQVEADSQTNRYHLTRILVEPNVKGTLPMVRGNITDVRLGAGNRPKFNKESPMRFEQRPLPMDHPEAVDSE